MTRPKSISGVLLLGAFCICAFATSGASAATYHECVKIAGTPTPYSDPGCTTIDLAGEYHTSPITAGPQSVTTTSTSPTGLSATIAGTKVTIQCGAVMSFEETAENVKVEEKPAIKGAGILEATECKVVEPSECKVKEGKFNTNKLEFNSEGLSFKYKPIEGESIATITLEGCKNGELNGGKLLKGTAKSEATSPATESYTAESGSALTLAGAKATMTGSYHRATKEDGKTLYQELP